MDDARWEKRASATGIGFVAALVAGYTIAPQPPKLSDSPVRFADYFVHNQSSVMVGTLLAAGVGGVMLLWWLGSLRLFLRRRESDGGRLSAVAFGSGLVALAILIQSLAIRAALAFGLSGTVDPSVEGPLQRLLHSGRAERLPDRRPVGRGLGIRPSFGSLPEMAHLVRAPYRRGAVGHRPGRRAEGVRVR